jgi:hypothetical protein
VTLKPCCAIGGELPDNVSCGAMCDGFPTCLPPPSPELLASVVALRASLAQEQEHHRAAVRALRILQQAITERIGE